MSEPIDAWTAAALGALQGLTEFLPVSSSGHVAIAESFLGFEEPSIGLSVLLHVGTLLATLWLFRHDVIELLGELRRVIRAPSRMRSTPEGRLVAQLLVATLITAVIGLSLRNVVLSSSAELRTIGLLLWGSALAVVATRFTKGDATELTMSSAVLVGIAQGIAVLPGLTRSGLTIATAMALGTRSDTAFRFSFLLSLPAIAGAAILELRDPQAMAALGPGALVGGVVALVTGYAALILLRRVVVQGHLWLFALYLVPVGAFLVFRGN